MISFELAVGALVGLAILGLWLINRTREESKRLPVSHELVTVFVIGFAVVIGAAYRSGVVKREPLLLTVTIAGLVTLAFVIVNLVLTRRLRRELQDVSRHFGEQMAGLGNLQFYGTKDETMRQLTRETRGAKEKLIATRFSPADIRVESEYWAAIKDRAFDPSILYIRIHCLAHTDPSAVEGVCRLVEELRGAKQFQLAIAMFNNSFEIIIGDERECIFCFHDLSMTIRNGFRLDSTQPNSSRVIANLDSTLRRMLEACHIVIDFERFVQSNADVRCLQDYLRGLHSEYCAGHLPRPVHPSEMDRFLRTKVFAEGGEAS
jgi:hypothetical protein